MTDGPVNETTRQRASVLLVLWFAGLYLRLPVLVAAPLAPLIGADLGLTQTETGALTTVPVLMLSIGALPGAFFIARLGPKVALAIALVVVSLASAARGFADGPLVLFANTALFGFAIAVMQPALPALVARWCPGYTALATAVYMNGMLIGEFIGGGLTLPLVLPLVGGDWGGALIVWSLPGLAAAMLVYLRDKQSQQPDPGRTPENVASHQSEHTAPILGAPVWRPPWRDVRLWQLGIVLGAASAGFFGANAYMGSVVQTVNQGERLAEFLFWFNATQVLGSLVMLRLAPVLAGRHWPIAATAAAVMLGLAGLSYGGSTLAFASVLILGFATCIQLILAVSLVPRIATARQAAPLAAGMFAIGYLLGFVVPLGGGIVADITGDPRNVLLPMTLLATVGMVVALSSRFGRAPPAADLYRQ